MVVTGACCTDENTCTDETQVDCATMVFGSYGGDNSVCLPGDVCFYTC